MTLPRRRSLVWVWPLAVLSAYPGVLADLAFVAILTSPLWLAALGVGGLALVCLRASSPNKPAGPALLADDEIGTGKAATAGRRWLTHSTAILALCFAVI